MGPKPKYIFAFCKTLNPLGETAMYGCYTMREAINCCINMRSKGAEETCARYTVYALDENGEFGKTLLNWQRDGQNTFGYLYDPEDPECAFAASPADVPLCLDADDPALLAFLGESFPL